VCKRANIRTPCCPKQAVHDNNIHGLSLPAGRAWAGLVLRNVFVRTASAVLRRHSGYKRRAWPVSRNITASPISMLVHCALGHVPSFLREHLRLDSWPTMRRMKFALDQGGSLRCGKEDASLTKVQELLRPDLTRTATYSPSEALRRNHKWLDAPSYT
jgi:hypothetical protein